MVFSAVDLSLSAPSARKQLQCRALDGAGGGKCLVKECQEAPFAAGEIAPVIRAESVVSFQIFVEPRYRAPDRIGSGLSRFSKPWLSGSSAHPPSSIPFSAA